jgi:hypothetical protein
MPPYLVPNLYILNNPLLRIRDEFSVSESQSPYKRKVPSYNSLPKPNLCLIFKYCSTKPFNTLTMLYLTYFLPIIRVKFLYRFHSFHSFSISEFALIINITNPMKLIYLYMLHVFYFFIINYLVILIVLFFHVYVVVKLRR